MAGSAVADGLQQEDDPVTAPYIAGDKGRWPLWLKAQARAGYSVRKAAQEQALDGALGSNSSRLKAGGGIFR
jgi:hypothetical protein